MRRSRHYNTMCYTEDKAHYVRYNNIISFTTVVAYLYYRYTHIYRRLPVRQSKKINDKPKIWHLHARNTIVVRGNNRRIKMSIGRYIILLRLRIFLVRETSLRNMVYDFPAKIARAYDDIMTFPITHII